MVAVLLCSTLFLSLLFFVYLCQHKLYIAAVSILGFLLFWLFPCYLCQITTKVIYIALLHFSFLWVTVVFFRKKIPVHNVITPSFSTCKRVFFIAVSAHFCHACFFIIYRGLIRKGYVIPFGWLFTKQPILGNDV